VPTQIQHTAKIEELTNRYDATSDHVAQALTSVSKAVREIAQSVNAQTEAIRSIRCKTFNQDALPDPHPAGKGTEAITAKNLDHG
jgi:methyl-accepting chemotaxis protein